MGLCLLSNLQNGALTRDVPEIPPCPDSQEMGSVMEGGPCICSKPPAPILEAPEAVAHLHAASQGS